MANAQAVEMMKETPMHQSYVQIAPHPEDFPDLLDAIGKAMAMPSDWSEEFKTIQTPTLLIFGDNDMIRPEHMVEFFQLLGGGLKDGGWMGENMSPHQWAVLPGTTHYNIFMSPLMVQIALQFFNQK